MYSQAHVTERCAPLALSRAWLLVIRRAEKVSLGSKEGLVRSRRRDRKGFHPRLRPFDNPPTGSAGDAGRANGRLKEPSVKKFKKVHSLSQIASSVKNQYH